ncbi:hypothetical protein WA026_006019 [Henosepilachna vigintioctopunctata]|uniref:ATP-binding cassette sub-family G member 4 n=1 Tax=Henosepilachna vigintioctopunctata TaxID=420089 RepID=A0AAW1THS3_9CUCU
MIQQIVEILRLTDSVQTIISELSGGQKKRLSIALELINNPLVMFLDEPTTGLDGVSCNQCLRLLKQLARQGRTIICSIHQPSASMFQVLDQVYVIANGNCLYQGSPANIVQFFEDVDASCPVYHNPADYVIEVACGEYGEEVVHKMLQLMEKGKSLTYVNGAELLPELNVLKERAIEESNNDDDENLQVTSQWNQLKVLLRRSWYKMKRDRTLTYMRIFTNIFIGIMLGIIFWEIGNDASRIKDNYNMLISVMMHHISPMMLLILTFPTEMSILIKEHFNRWYSLKMYFISVTLVDIPLSVLCCIIFTSEVYYMSGQPLELLRFAMFFSICVLIVLIVQSFGLMVGAVFDVVSGNFVGPAIAIPTMMFAGFPIRVRDLPNWLYWGCYVSYLRYALEAMAAAIYGMQRGKLKCPEDADFCIIAAPSDFLDDIGIRGDQFWEDVGALILFVIVFKISAYLLLRRKIMKLR